MAGIVSAIPAVAAAQSDQQLLGLPVELLLHIARFLRTRDGLMYAATSRRLRVTTASFVYELYIRHEHPDNAPLWHAVRHTGMLDLAKRFLDAGADPNQPPHSLRRHGSRLSLYGPPKDEGDTLLIGAVRNENVPMVRLLLEHGAEVTTRAYSEGNPTFEHTPITLAAHLGNLEIVRLLLGLRDDEQTDIPQLARRSRLHVRDSLGSTALHHAAGSGHDHVVAFLVSQGASVNATDTRGDTALRAALYENHLSTIRLLIEAGTNLHMANCEDETALDTAASRVREDGDSRLLALQAMLQADPRVAPHRVVNYLASCDWPVVKLLLSMGFDPNTVYGVDGCTPLWTRARWSHDAHTDEHREIRAAHLLIDGGANVDFRHGHVGQTPLMAAAMTGSIMMMRVLLDRGASIAARDLSGMSVLGHATVRGKADMVAFLLDHLLSRPGPDTSLREELEWRNEDGMTPLLLALHDDTTSFKVFERLLEHGYGATQAATRKGDSSALKVAIAHADLDSRILHIIIEKCGLDVNALLPDLGTTPLEYAISLRSQAASKCLLEMGARVDGLEGDERPDHEAPIVMAIRACDLKIVGILLDHGADLSLALCLQPDLIREIPSHEDAEPMTELLAQHMTPDLRAQYEL